MFDTHSIYALNKLDRTAIVCTSATGNTIRLTRDDFSSEEEFAQWKGWSDEDYRKIEIAGKNDDRCISFDSQRDMPVQSAEDAVLAPYIAAEENGRRIQMLESIKIHLTEKQYRRLMMRVIKKYSVEKIASLEGVSDKAVYACLKKVEQIIVNIL